MNTTLRHFVALLLLGLSLTACNDSEARPPASAASDTGSTQTPTTSPTESATTDEASTPEADPGPDVPQHLRDAAFCDKVDREQMGASFGSINGAGVELTGSTKPSASAPAWSCEFEVDLGGGTTGRMVMRLQPQGATESSVAQAVASFTTDHGGKASCSSTEMSEWPVGGRTTCNSDKGSAAAFNGLFGKGSFECSAIFSATNETRVLEVAYAVCPPLFAKVAQK